MAPVTHLFLSWIIAAKTTNNPRDCRLVTFAGVLPDADGLGIVVDMFNNAIHHTQDYPYYHEFHHWYMHGIFGAILTSCALAAFARQRWRVLFLCLLVYHLHLLCDILGSRGQSPGDLWPIFYLGPFSYRGMVVWRGQWWLDGWQNRTITVVLFFWALWMASGREDSVVGVFNRRVDRVFVGVLHKWRDVWLKRKSNPSAGGGI